MNSCSHLGSTTASGILLGETCLAEVTVYAKQGYGYQCYDACSSLIVSSLFFACSCWCRCVVLVSDASGISSVVVLIAVVRCSLAVTFVRGAVWSQVVQTAMLMQHSNDIDGVHSVW